MKMRVKSREELELLDINMIGLTNSMLEFCGQVFEVYERKNGYVLLKDNPWSWLEEWLEPVEEENLGFKIEADSSMPEDQAKLISLNGNEETIMNLGEEKPEEKKTVLELNKKYHSDTVLPEYWIIPRAIYKDMMIYENWDGGVGSVNISSCGWLPVKETKTVDRWATDGFLRELENENIHTESFSNLKRFRDSYFKNKITISWE